MPAALSIPVHLIAIQVIASARMQAHLLHWCPVLHNEGTEDSDSDDGSHLKID